MTCPKMVSWLFAVALVVVLSPVLVHAAEPTALRVLVVETADADAYAKEIENGRVLLKRMEIPAQIRVWKARFAGDRTGTVVVGVEFPNLTELAKAEARMAADTEYMTWLRGLDKHRKIVSDSIYFEMKP